MSPTILFVPGWWVGTAPYGRVIEMLISDGLEAEVTTIPSTDTFAPNNPSMNDDIAAVRQHVEGIFGRGKDVLLVLHSAGAFIGGAAAHKLSKKDRGNLPSIVGIVYTSGAIFPEGVEPQAPPVTIQKDGAIYCDNPGEVLFNDFSDEERNKWIPLLKPQPCSNWGDKLAYSPLKDIPSVYIIFEKDNAIPPPVQEHLASVAGSKIERVAGGHMSMLSMPQQVADIVKATAVTCD